MFKDLLVFFFFNNPRWCFLCDAFVNIGEGNFRFFEGGFHQRAKRCNCLFFFFPKTLFGLRIEDTAIKWVGWAGFEFCIVLEGQFFSSEL